MLFPAALIFPCLFRSLDLEMVPQNKADTGRSMLDGIPLTKEEASFHWEMIAVSEEGQNAKNEDALWCEEAYAASEVGKSEAQADSNAPLELSNVIQTQTPFGRCCLRG